MNHEDEVHIDFIIRVEWLDNGVERMYLARIDGVRLVGAGPTAKQAVLELMQSNKKLFARRRKH